MKTEEDDEELLICNRMRLQIGDLSITFNVPNEKLNIPEFIFEK